MLTTKKIVFVLLVLMGYTYGVPALTDLLEQFRKGNYNFTVGQSLTVYDFVNSIEDTYTVQKLDNYNSCLGITTNASETVILQCPDKKPKDPGCFEIFTPDYTQNSTDVHPRKIVPTCVEYDGTFYCVVLETPNKWIVYLECPTDITTAPLVDVPFNIPPPRL